MNAPRVMSRLSNIRCKFNPISNFLKSSSPYSSLSPSSTNRISLISRLPVEKSSSIMTMLPLHSAIASARLQSVLSADSQSGCLVPQGISMPL